MIGIVIVTHGRLAEELRLALEHVVGPQGDLAAICIGPEDDSQCRCLDVQHSIEAVDHGDGVVLLTDMFGGTPSNLCIAQMVRPGVEVLGGVNLPMLVKLAKVRSVMPLAEAIQIATAAGRKYIAVASDVLPHCRDGLALASAGAGSDAAPAAAGAAMPARGAEFALTPGRAMTGVLAARG